MSQSKSTLAGEMAGTKQTAPVKNIVDTAIGAGNHNSGCRDFTERPRERGLSSYAAGGAHR